MLLGNTVCSRLCEMIQFDGDETTLLPFCNLAAAVICEKAKPGADYEDIRLVSAAAMLAYNRYLLAKSASDCEFGSVRAGEITVSSNGSDMVSAAKAMLDAALTDAAELLVDNSFSFGVM